MTAHTPEKDKTKKADTTTSLSIDFDEFAHLFEDEDITEDEAREFLQVYWSLAIEIMSLGFGFHPVQQAKKACGKDHETHELLPIPASDKVYLTQDYISENFESVADQVSDQTGKGVET